MSGTTPILDIADLWVGFPSYGSATVHALRGINLRVAPGEILGLVGEFGVGKDHAGTRRYGAGARTRCDRARSSAVR